MSETKTRDKIIQAMYNLSAEKGFDKASIGLICQQVGITKPSVYFYFKNKEEIYLETIRTVYSASDSWIPSLEEIGSAAEYYESILQFGYTVIDNYHSDVERRRFISEIHIQSTRLSSVYSFLDEHRRKREIDMEAFVRKGFDFDFFSGEKNAAEIAELLEIVLIGMGDQTFTKPGFNGKPLWKTLIDSLRAD